MEDEAIIDLYWQRDEEALRQSDKKYGAFCRQIALRIVGILEDAEECVNDTWMRRSASMTPGCGPGKPCRRRGPAPCGRSWAESREIFPWIGIGPGVPRSGEAVPWMYCWRN